MEFCKKSRIPPFSSLLCWTGKNLWCNMSPVFGGNFLTDSFSQEKPCQKVEAHIMQVAGEGTASQPMQFELCFLWQNGSGSSASHPIGGCFLSNSYS